MQVVDIKVQKRENSGKKAAKAVRREGLIPGVIYAGGESKSFAVHPNAVKSLIYTPDFKIANIDLDGQQMKCILKDLQLHPVTDEVIHIDLQHMADDRKIKIEIPVRFDGTSVGQRAGGSLVQQLRKVRVKTLPDNVVDELRADISNLDLGQSVRVRDLNVPEGIEVMNPGATPLAIVEVPRALRSAKDAAAKEGDAPAEEKGATAE